MRSLIFLGLWAPRLSITTTCPQKVSVPESARRKPRTPLRLWPPQRTSTLPFHKDSSKRSKSGSCLCSWALGRKLSLPWEPETSSDPSRRASRSHPRTPAFSRRSEKPAIAKAPSLPRRVRKLWATFFERPPFRKAGNGAAHSRLRDLHARLIQKSLAMLPEGKIGIGLQLFGEPLPQCLALN